MPDSTDIAVRNVHDIIGCVAHFYEKGNSGNKKEVHSNKRRKDKRSTKREEIHVMQFIEQAINDISGYKHWHL